MEDVKILKIAELVQRGIPVTGTNAVYSHLRSRRIPPKPNLRFTSSSPSPSTDSNPNPKILTPLNFPAIIIGTLTLPTDHATNIYASKPTSRCPYNNCLKLSDGSAIVCCDILDLDLGMIGEEIHVLAWNFVPFRRDGGFLEIVKWRYPDSRRGLAQCSSVNLYTGSSTASEDTSKARYCLCGALEFVSPVSIVPCIIARGKSMSDKVPDSSSGSTIFRGFYAQLLVCDCKLCNSKKSVMLTKDPVPEHGTHSFSKSELVYFCGSASSWHPVITKLLGRFVTLLGLKKKLVFTGKDESRLMYISTEKSALHLPRLAKEWLPFTKTIIKGNGECGSYAGLVKGVYMQGMIVELDTEVWLLLTDRRHTPPHGLRVGSVISVRNVHFVDPRFSWTKMLILGACIKTSIIVESFSPLDTGCHVILQSRSMFGKFIELLPFSATLWALLEVSSFQKKFAGVLSEKEILGSKDKEGLAQMYASLHLPMSVLRSRYGVLVELYNHDLCGCGGKPCVTNLKPVVPFSSFFNYCELTWSKMLQSGKGSEIMCKNIPLSCEGEPFCQTYKKIYYSEDIGVVLVGRLKASPGSEKLQLCDTTGSIDVLVPDLPSTLNANSIYEVMKYSLIIEGNPQLVDLPGVEKSFSCGEFFHEVSLARHLNLSIYVFFSFSDAKCIYSPLSSCLDWKEDLKRPENGTYHLLRIVHKFPMLHKFEGDPKISHSSSMFVEAVINSWNLFLAGDSLAKNSEENSFHKRPRIDHASAHVRNLDLIGNFGDSGFGISACSNSCKCLSWEQRDSNLSSHKIPCFATVRNSSYCNQGISGFLFKVQGKLSSGICCRPIAQKVLLEVEPKSFYTYQLLQIGNYYIVKHYKEDPYCGPKNSDCLSVLKLLITSRTRLWRISFSSDEVHDNLANCNASQLTHSNSYSFNNSEVLFEDKVELCLQTCSEVCLHLPSNLTNLLEADTKELNEDLINPVLRSQSVESHSLFPEGNLLSLQGQVVAFHNVNQSYINAEPYQKSFADASHCWFFPGSESSYCIHLLVDNHNVRIFSPLRKQVFPVGFGPGINATFHRILETGEQRRLMLTPVSSIVINSISISNDPCCNDYLDSSPNIYDTPSKKDTVSSGLISELINCFNCKQIRFHCRVVSVNILILEKNRNYVDLPSEIPSRPPLIHIPLAGFVLDDGSSTCCCWTRGERAATMLRLHELPWNDFETSWELSLVGIDQNLCGTTADHLERILNNHGRIITTSYGSMLESSYQDLDVSVTSDEALSIADENLLKLIIFNACVGTIWTVIGSLMDSNSVRKMLKEHNIQLETLQPMENVLASEVRHTDSLNEARKIMLELRDG